MTKLYVEVDKWGKNAKSVRNKIKSKNIVVDRVKLAARQSVKGARKTSHMNRYQVKYHLRK